MTWLRSSRAAVVGVGAEYTSRAPGFVGVARRRAPATRSCLRDDAEHTADVARLDADRIVRDVEIGVLDESVTLNDEEEIAGPKTPRRFERRRLAIRGGQPVCPRSHSRLPAWASQCVRMLGAEDAAVRVVGTEP